ncbi:acyltransferase family protein [Pedobacter sp.]|uniref:acyltransferase family protein n=1 Tax=Pedobacter sp. TaxID=1411316 RepID=UPI00396C369D
MQNTELVQEKKNFDFVDTIRCIAMMGIVFEHSVYSGTYIFDSFSLKHIVYISLIQLSKFGTIAFFVLAGFLLGSKFVSYSSWQYFKRRLSTVFVPWLIWSSIFITVVLIQQYIVLKDKFDLRQLLPEKLKMTYLYTNYWFIINFLFCIGLLLIFKRFLYKWWLGVIFLLFSLTYSVNVYFEWYTPSHTTAIFGFVFYLWLGAMLNKNWVYIEQKLKHISYPVIIILFILSFVCSVWDSMNLINLQSSDPYNTLRISNIFYSLITIFLLLKIKNFGFTKYLKPRETTFGVYLIHYILVTNLLPEIFRPFKLPQIQDMSLAGMFAYVCCRFMIVYGTTLLLIWGISKSRAKWIIGRT